MYIFLFFEKNLVFPDTIKFFSLCIVPNNRNSPTSSSSNSARVSLSSVAAKSDLADLEVQNVKLGGTSLCVTYGKGRKRRRKRATGRKKTLRRASSIGLAWFTACREFTRSDRTENFSLWLTRNSRSITFEPTRRAYSLTYKSRTHSAKLRERSICAMYTIAE